MNVANIIYENTKMASYQKETRYMMNIFAKLRVSKDFNS